MPLNLMTLTGASGKKVHVNPAQIESVEPGEERGAVVKMNSGAKFEVIDDHLRIVETANRRAPDGF